MRSSRKLTVLGAVMLSSAGFAAATPSANAGPASLYAPSAVVLTVAHGDAADVAIERAVTLSCAPRPAGTHPSPASACKDLLRANGDFTNLVVRAGEQTCSEDYAPVTVGIQGVWRGRQTSWQYTFFNSCEKEAALSESSAFSF
ncbi:subtilase-type protease inhibitor [Streptomyces sp. NPDC055085]